MSLTALPTLVLIVLAQAAPAATRAPATAYPPPREVKDAFVTLLDRPKVPLEVTLEAIQRGDDRLLTERLSFASERKADGTVERVPMLLVRPDLAGRSPAVIVLHGTGGNKEGMRSWLDDLTRRGIVGVAIDARYHGDRARGAVGASAHNDAIIRAWRSRPGRTQEHPFYYDTCWDLWRTLDYLATRDDVDPKRLGMLGISMGGIETWLAAAVDERVTVAVPAIAVQCFRWRMENGRWEGRARTIAAAHLAAARDLGEPEVNARVCQALWDKVIPGILGPFDGPSMLRLLAGRPLLILNGDRDPNCPIEGAERAFAEAEAAFQRAGTPERLRMIVAHDVGHAITAEQRQAALDWFVLWLKP